MAHANPFSLAGRRALVSGGSRGIGLGVALAMADAGASIALVSRDPAALAAARARITERGGAAAVYPCDLTDLDGMALYRRVRADGPVDILVKPATPTSPTSTASMPCTGGCARTARSTSW